MDLARFSGVAASMEELVAQSLTHGTVTLIEEVAV